MSFRRKKINTVLISLIALGLGLFHACRQPVEGEANGGFAIYLLDDPECPAGEASEKSLQSLALADEPLLTSEDIVSYEWWEHRITLKSGAADRIRIIADSNATVLGLPFVVRVGSEPIYLGAFWWAFSSLAPAFPHIELVFAFDRDESPIMLCIEPSWIERDPDPRYDMRILRALRRDGVLIL